MPSDRTRRRWQALLDDVARADDPEAQILCPADYHDLIRRLADMEAAGTSACGLVDLAANMYRVAFNAKRKCSCTRCARAAKLGASMLRRRKIVEAAQHAWEITQAVEGHDYNTAR
jgi:hypothetical protein